MPVYNKQDVVAQFHQEITDAFNNLQFKFRIYYNNDGSTDDARLLIDEISSLDPRITAVELSRNLGHKAVITAGLNLAEVAAVLTIDNDVQYPPR